MNIVEQMAKAQDHLDQDGTIRILRLVKRAQGAGYTVSAEFKQCFEHPTLKTAKQVIDACVWSIFYTFPQAVDHFAHLKWTENGTTQLALDCSSKQIGVARSRS